jgi:autotransporter-associated beta strand protein
MQANFYGSITAPSTINVDGANTVGRITFDNANRYTLGGAGSIILDDSADQSQINVRTGSHTIAVPVTLASDTIITVIPTTSTLTMSGVISSSGNYGITESGFGTLLLSNANTYTGDTNVSSGTLTVTGSIASTNVITAAGAILNAAGSVNAGLNKSTVLNSGGVVNIGPNTGTSGPSAVTLASIEIGLDPTSKLTVNASPLHANRTVLVTSGLSFDSTTAGQLDLQNNDMIIHGSTLAAVQPLIQSGENLSGGTGTYWNGPGIVSSMAASNATFLTTLGLIVNNNGSGQTLYGSGDSLGLFDGQNPALNDLLIKYTYYGDANLDGQVDGSDYTKIDNGFNNHLTGWANGDFNYDGIIDGSDYTLIDNAFNTQGASLAAQVANVASTVPEPAGFGLLSLVSLTLLRRRAQVCYGK